MGKKTILFNEVGKRVEFFKDKAKAQIQYQDEFGAWHLIEGEVELKMNELKYDKPKPPGSLYNGQYWMDSDIRSNPCYIIVREHQSVPSNPRLHRRFDLAQEEAKRLALLTPGVKYYIFSSMAHAIANAVEVIETSNE